MIQFVNVTQVTYQVRKHLLLPWLVQSPGETYSKLNTMVSHNWCFNYRHIPCAEESKAELYFLIIMRKPLTNLLLHEKMSREHFQGERALSMYLMA